MSKLPAAKTRKSFDFSIVAVRHRWEDKAARYALSSLVPGTSPETPGEDRISATQLALVAAWRRRVKALAKGGWKRANDPDKCKYLLGCPPVGVFTHPGRLHCCRRAAICPFCWCRQHVVAAYRNLKRHVNGRDVGQESASENGDRANGPQSSPGSGRTGEAMIGPDTCGRGVNRVLPFRDASAAAS